MQCENCNAYFEPKRNDSKFCSPNCRVENHRKRDKDVPLVEVEDIKESTVVLPTKPKVEKCKCHGCGEDVNELVCICYKCICNGITHKSLGLDINDCKNENTN